MKSLYLARQSIRWIMAFLALFGIALLYPPHANGAALQQDQQPLVAHVLRYSSSEAGEVTLVWGVNGWQLVPESQRPAGTTLGKKANQVMQTPMNRSNGQFEISIQAPAGATIDYIFHITRARSGVSAEAWDLNGSPEQDFHTVVVANGVTVVTPTITLGEELFSSAADTQLQWIAALIVAGITLIIGLVALRLLARNPFLNF